MTVKTQGGKVITKGGKVSCSCCEIGCCMYPAQALADELYTVDDLPDDVTVDGTSFPRSDTTYGNTTNGVILEDNVWVKYTSGSRSSRPCLIQGGVVDQFANTYTVTTSNGSVLVSRQSLCVWKGLDSCGNAWWLVYGESSEISGTRDLSWNIVDAEISDPCEVPPLIRGFSWKNDGENNTPLGIYPNGTAVDATVS